MNNNEYQTVGLYDHNAASYNLVKESFESGNDVVGIVHATGTGKSYNALQLAYDNRNKKIIYVVPSNGIIEHIKKIIEDNPNLDLKRDFPNLEFRTYQSFISLSEDEISDIDCDLLILDEFHHIGAPVWGARINTMIDTHPNMKIFGMTAYTVRDRGTSYERDMANPDTDELFSRRIESRYDLCDAMIDGVLPKPVYKTAYINLLKLTEELEKISEKQSSNTKNYQECMPILKDIKKKIHEAPSIPDILKKNIKPNGKYIFFCPPCSEEGTNDIETIKKQAIEWFKQFVPEEDIVIYTSTSEMGVDGKKNRNAFYDDVTLDGKKADNKLRIMFAINQYNEGIHAPNIDGVILGRGTTSDIVYFEQLGRALSVRGNTKDKFEELEKYTIEELTKMCNDKDIPIKDNTSKEEIIEKLIAPIIIDLTNNYDFIKELENNLKDRIRYIQENGLGQHREIKIKDASFDIEIENKDLFEMLKYVMDKITMTWEDKYELAKAYYEHYGNLEIPRGFKTTNGVDEDENGIALGGWIHTQRQIKKGTSQGQLTPEQIELLNNIGMRWGFDLMAAWIEKYELAKAYYEHYGNLEIPQKFKTINGYEYDENGIALGRWLDTQKQVKKGKSGGLLTSEQIELLNKIGIKWNVYEDNWMEKYKLAKAYYEHYGNLDIPKKFKTINGYDEDENGIALGSWVDTQRYVYNNSRKGILTPKQIELLNKIGIKWNIYEDNWMRKYELAKAYYEHYGNLEIPQNFETINGYEPDENGIALGHWLDTQRQVKKGKNRGLLTSEQIELLNKIGIKWNIYEDNWMRKYELAKAYYEHYGNLEISRNFKTINGYEPDENGIALGAWLNAQRRVKKCKSRGLLTSEQIELLNKIGMRWEKIDKMDDWMKYYELAKKYYEENGNLKISQKYVTIDGVKLGQWLSNQRQAYKGKNLGTISEEKIKLLEDIGIIWFEEKTDDKLQAEEITDKNKNRKQIEILNRFMSLISQYNDNYLPSNEEINNDFMEQLNNNKKM